MLWRDSQLGEGTDEDERQQEDQGWGDHEQRGGCPEAGLGGGFDRNLLRVVGRVTAHARLLRFVRAGRPGGAACGVAPPGRTSGVRLQLSLSL